MDLWSLIMYLEHAFKAFIFIPPDSYELSLDLSLISGPLLESIFYNLLLILGSFYILSMFYEALLFTPSTTPSPITGSIY